MLLGTPPVSVVVGCKDMTMTAWPGRWRKNWLSCSTEQGAAATAEAQPGHVLGRRDAGVVGAGGDPGRTGGVSAGVRGRLRSRSEPRDNVEASALCSLACLKAGVADAALYSTAGVDFLCFGGRGRHPNSFIIFDKDSSAVRHASRPTPPPDLQRYYPVVRTFQPPSTEEISN